MASRLRRSDARSGWLIATGGAFLTIVVALSTAKGIVHPYYIAQLAPFTAALVGAGAAQLLTGDRIARVLAPLAVAAGVAGELIVLDNNPGQLTWLVPLLVGVGLFTAALLAVIGRGRLRAAVLAAAFGALLLAPASWAAGHARAPDERHLPGGRAEQFRLRTGSRRARGRAGRRPRGSPAGRGSAHLRVAARPGAGRAAADRSEGTPGP